MPTQNRQTAAASLNEVQGMAEEVASLLLFLLSSEVATFMGAEVEFNGCASL
jgi:hypothetical protein